MFIFHEYFNEVSASGSSEPLVMVQTPNTGIIRLLIAILFYLTGYEGSGEGDKSMESHNRKGRNKGKKKSCSPEAKRRRSDEPPLGTLTFIRQHTYVMLWRCFHGLWKFGLHVLDNRLLLNFVVMFFTTIGE